jgi:nucleolar protein 4
MGADGTEPGGRTVFVRNVSYDVDDKGLEEAFNDVGPVRQAFLVREKGQARHKGYGYVQFALGEDAERAVQELHGRALRGRAIKVRAVPPPGRRRRRPAAAPPPRRRCARGARARRPGRRAPAPRPAAGLPPGSEPRPPPQPPPAVAGVPPPEPSPRARLRPLCVLPSRRPAPRRRPHRLPPCCPPGRDRRQARAL